MKNASILLLCAMTACATTPKEPEKVLFLCPYGGAKSVIAASWFNRMAGERALPYVAVATAAEAPYDAVPEKVADALARDGFDVRNFQPRHVEAEQLRSANKVISIDCDLTKLDANGATIEQWDDVPKVSVDLDGSIAAIKRHVEQLIAQLAAR